MGFYGLNLSLLQTCQITARVNFVNKRVTRLLLSAICTFIVIHLLPKVWAEFRGKNSDGHKKVRKFI